MKGGHRTENRAADLHGRQNQRLVLTHPLDDALATFHEGFCRLSDSRKKSGPDSAGD